MELGFSKMVSGNFDDVCERTKAELKEVGFGIVSEIDLKKTFAEKLNEDFRPYTILGACNPVLAKKAVEAMSDVGLLLPCNVTVAQEVDGVRVTAIDPKAMLMVAGSHPALDEIAEDAAPRLKRAIEALS